MTTQEVGRRGELAVMRWLTERGCDVERMPSYWPFDLLADGKRIEVKNCQGFGLAWHWYVSRSKTTLVHKADLYIFRAEQFTETTNLHFILPRPLLQPWYHLHWRSIQRWRNTYQNFETEY